MLNIINKIEKIVSLFHNIGQVYLVGGTIRDYLIDSKNFKPKDIDLEIHNVSYDVIKRKLTEENIKFSEVGKSFGVFKLNHKGVDVDISLPRKDSKTNIGHKGFSVDVDPFMGIKEALRRRDFTINAIAVKIWVGPEYFDEENTDPIPFSSEWQWKSFDPFNGIEDIKRGVLRMVDPVTFADDPLRVMRGVQFASRFNLLIEKETFEFMKRLV